MFCQQAKQPSQGRAAKVATATFKRLTTNTSYYRRMLSLFTVLDPKGAIGLAERTLMYHAMGFMLIVAVIVYFLLFFFAWRYRAGNKKAKYLPNWEHGRLEELAGGG